MFYAYCLLFSRCLSLSLARACSLSCNFVLSRCMLFALLALSFSLARVSALSCTLVLPICMLFTLLTLSSFSLERACVLSLVLLFSPYAYCLLFSRCLFLSRARVRALFCSLHMHVACSSHVVFLSRARCSFSLSCSLVLSVCMLFAVRLASSFSFSCARACSLFLTLLFSPYA